MVLLDGFNTLEQTKFGTKFIELVYYAHKLNVFPTANKVVLFNKQYGKDLILKSLSSIGSFDLSPFTNININGDPLKRRTNACLLRLFLILIMDDCMYEDLMTSKVSPSHGQMDTGNVGD
jgi:hypothetical protein